MTEPQGIRGTQTYIIECNRGKSVIDENAPQDQNAKWTTETDFQFKRGDRVSVEAIMIESQSASNTGQSIEFEGELVRDGDGFKPYVDNAVLLEFGFYMNNNGVNSIQLPIALGANFLGKGDRSGVLTATTGVTAPYGNFTNGASMNRSMPLLEELHSIKPATIPVNQGDFVVPAPPPGGVRPAYRFNNPIPAGANGGGYGEQQYPGCGKGFGGHFPQRRHAGDSYDRMPQGPSGNFQITRQSVYSVAYFVRATNTLPELDPDYAYNLHSISSQAIPGEIYAGVLLARPAEIAPNNSNAAQQYNRFNFPNLVAQNDAPCPPLSAKRNQDNIFGTTNMDNGEVPAGKGRRVTGMNCEITAGMELWIGQEEIGSETAIPPTYENWGTIRDVCYMANVNFNDLTYNPGGDPLAELPPDDYGGAVFIRLKLAFTGVTPFNLADPVNPVRPINAYGVPRMGGHTTMYHYNCQDGAINTPCLTNHSDYVEPLNLYGSDRQAHSRLGLGLTNGSAQPYDKGCIFPAGSNGDVNVDVFTWGPAAAYTGYKYIGSGFQPQNMRRLGGGLLWEMTRTYCQLDQASPFWIGAFMNWNWKGPWVEGFSFFPNMAQGGINDMPQFGLSRPPAWTAGKNFDTLYSALNGVGWTQPALAGPGGQLMCIDPYPLFTNVDTTNSEGLTSANTPWSDFVRVRLGIPEGDFDAGSGFTNTSYAWQQPAGILAPPTPSPSANWGEWEKRGATNQRHWRTLNLKDFKDNYPYILVRPTYQGCQVTPNGVEEAPLLEPMTCFVWVKADESFEDVSELANKFIRAFHEVNDFATTIDDRDMTSGGFEHTRRMNNCLPYYSTGFFPASWGVCDEMENAEWKGAAAGAGPCWDLGYLGPFSGARMYPRNLTPCDGYTNEKSACWDRIAPSFDGNLVKVIPANIQIGVDWDKQEQSPYFYTPNDNCDYLQTGGCDIGGKRWGYTSGPGQFPGSFFNLATGDGPFPVTEPEGDYVRKYKSNRGTYWWNNQIYGNMGYKDFTKAWCGDRFNRLECFRLNYDGTRSDFMPTNNSGVGAQHSAARQNNDVPRPVIINTQLRKTIARTTGGFNSTARVAEDSVPPGTNSNANSNRSTWGGQQGLPGPFPGGFLPNAPEVGYWQTERFPNVIVKQFRGTILKKNQVLMTNIYWNEKNLKSLQEIFRTGEKYDTTAKRDQYGMEDAVNGEDAQEAQNNNWFYDFDLGQADDSALSMNSQYGCEAGFLNGEKAYNTLGQDTMGFANQSGAPFTGRMLKVCQPNWTRPYRTDAPASQPTPGQYANAGVITDATCFGCPVTACPYNNFAPGGPYVTGGPLQYGTGLAPYAGATAVSLAVDGGVLISAADPLIDQDNYDQKPICWNDATKPQPQTRTGPLVPNLPNPYGVPVAGIDSNTRLSISPSQSWGGMGFEQDYRQAKGCGVVRCCSRWNDLWDDYPPMLNRFQPWDYGTADNPNRPPVQPVGPVAGDKVGTGLEPIPLVGGPLEDCNPAGVIWNGVAGPATTAKAAGWATAEGLDCGDTQFGADIAERLPHLKDVIAQAKKYNLGVVPYYWTGMNNDGNCVHLESDAFNKVGDPVIPGASDTGDHANPCNRFTNADPEDIPNKYCIMIGFVVQRDYLPEDEETDTWELGDIHWGDLFGWSLSFYDNPAIIPHNTDKIDGQEKISCPTQYNNWASGQTDWTESVKLNTDGPIEMAPNPCFNWNNMNYVWVGANNASMVFNDDAMRFELGELYTSMVLSQENTPQDVSGAGIPQAGTPIIVLNTDLPSAEGNFSCEEVPETSGNPPGAVLADGQINMSKQSLVAPSAGLSGPISRSIYENLDKANRGIQDAQCGVYIKDIWLPPENWTPPEGINLQNYYNPEKSVVEDFSAASGQAPDIAIDGTAENHALITRDLTKANKSDMWEGCLMDKMGWDYRQLIPYAGKQSNRFVADTYASEDINRQDLGVKPLIQNSQADTTIQPTTNVVGDGAYAGTPAYAMGFINNVKSNIGGVLPGVLVANRLPTLFACPFYLVMSDICPTQFQSGNFKQECMFYGLKNYGAGQYFYVFGSNYSQLVDTDHTQTSITTEIRNPLSGRLAKLSRNSCILYKVQRDIELPPAGYNVDGVNLSGGPPLPPAGIENLGAISFPSVGSALSGFSGNLPTQAQGETYYPPVTQGGPPPPPPAGGMMTGLPRNIYRGAVREGIRIAAEEPQHPNQERAGHPNQEEDLILRLEVNNQLEQAAADPIQYVMNAPITLDPRRRVRERIRIRVAAENRIMREADAERQEMVAAAGPVAETAQQQIADALVVERAERQVIRARERRTLRTDPRFYMGTHDTRTE